ncbi:MAG: hypothetical protein QOD93_556 [Acetobacteraceae bacterium]|nr:hypothetical protein [Acetobacteraceae bacterium]
MQSILKPPVHESDSRVVDNGSFAHIVKGATLERQPIFRQANEAIKAHKQRLRMGKFPRYIPDAPPVRYAELNIGDGLISANEVSSLSPKSSMIAGDQSRRPRKIQVLIRQEFPQFARMFRIQSAHTF